VKLMKTADPATRAILNKARLRAMAQAGFAKHRSGKTNFQPADFETPEAFETDELGYVGFLMSALAGGSFQSLFQKAQALLGAYAGLVTLQTPKANASPHQPASRPTALYRAWLLSDPVRLKDSYLERKRLSSA
jgi:hypothetical protein